MHARRSDTKNRSRHVWGISIIFLREPIWLEIRQRYTEPRNFKQTHCSNVQNELLSLNKETN